MLEAIALKLVTSLTGYLFEGYLDTFKSIEVEGAPSWYGKSSPEDQLVGYGYQLGGIESIELARSNCTADLDKRINKLVEVSIYDNFKRVKDPKEKELLNRFKTDPELYVFITKYMKFEKIEHFEKKSDGLFTNARPAQTFTSCMIPKQAIVTYQTERLTLLQKELVDFKADNSIDEMDAEIERMKGKQ